MLDLKDLRLAVCSVCSLSFSVESFPRSVERGSTNITSNETNGTIAEAVMKINSNV